MSRQVLGQLAAAAAAAAFLAVTYSLATSPCETPRETIAGVAKPVIDPFAALLWTLTDIWLGEPLSYASGVYPALKQIAPTGHADLSLYPAVLPALAAFSADARAAADWGAFLRKWSTNDWSSE